MSPPIERYSSFSKYLKAKNFKFLIWELKFHEYRLTNSTFNIIYTKYEFGYKSYPSIPQTT